MLLTPPLPLYIFTLRVKNSFYIFGNNSVVCLSYTAWPNFLISGYKIFHQCSTIVVVT